LRGGRGRAAREGGPPGHRRGSAEAAWRRRDPGEAAGAAAARRRAAAGPRRAVAAGAGREPDFPPIEEEPGGTAMTKLSPLAPARFPELPAVAGVEIATAASGIRYKGRDDLLMMRFGPRTTAAGVLTRSRTASAPVLWCREALASGRPARGLLVNAGNANAFTGARGRASVDR